MLRRNLSGWVSGEERGRLIHDNSYNQGWHLGSGLESDYLCTCVRKGYLGSDYHLTAIKQCTNCLGYGIMPVPEFELTKEQDASST
jgi:hypothetical protein